MAVPDDQLTLRASLLQKAGIFSSLKPEEIDIIAGSSAFLELEEDEQIFSEGDPGDALYIVESGEVVVRKVDQNSRVTDIARFVPGNCFGELDLLTKSARTASAFVSEETRLLVFPRPGTRFEMILQEHPAISAEILHKILVDIAVRIRKANALVKENSPLVQELRKQVYRDKLTGLFNQTYLEEKTGELIHRKHSPFSLLIIKPDNFKALNDQYGHEAGDIAIRVIGRGLRKHVGDDEKVVRYKGNAMAVIMPECGKNEAVKEAEGIRNFMKSLDLTEATGGSNFSITSSIGITLFPDHGCDPEELIQKSHELPLVGRARGGDQVLFPEDA